MKPIIPITLTAIALLASCKSQQDSTTTTTATTAPAPAPVPGQVIGGTRPAMLAPVIIYKTAGDYDNLVPITLDASGNSVVSYPAPSDLRATSQPVKLNDGYLYDRRGVTAQSVFTDYTYEQYAALPAVPTTDELLKHVKHRQPFTEMYVVEGLHNPTADQLNDIIAKGFQGCKAIIK